MEDLLSTKIKILRKKMGISQKTLSEYMGISDKAVSKWETGLSKPSVKNIFELAKIFNVPMEYFDAAASDEKAYKKKSGTGMESLTELYRIGRGPSSSHTIAPERAALIFKQKNSTADAFSVILYGSLARTGRGHGTDEVIKKTLSPTKCNVQFNYNAVVNHPNTMDFIAYKNNVETSRKRVISTGGGSIVFEGEDEKCAETVYEYNKFSDIADYCKTNGLRLWEYVFLREDKSIEQYLSYVWQIMKKSIKKGLYDEGILPGGLGVSKKAKLLFESQHINESAEIRENRLVCSYAYAVGEQNASGEEIVTAPTCGAAGVLPAVLYYYSEKNNFSDTQIIRALATAGLIGNLIKTNVSISGAECGCQAEIGSACAMASAALGELFGLSTEKIEYAAEISIEHHLGLTCDPILGLVQIPCIERNAVAAMRAINAVSLASFLWNTRKISFDEIVITMRDTGRDMSFSYKETAEAGISKIPIK